MPFKTRAAGSGVLRLRNARMEPEEPPALNPEAGGKGVGDMPLRWMDGNGPRRKKMAAETASVSKRGELQPRMAPIKTKDHHEWTRPTRNKGVTHQRARSRGGVDAIKAEREIVGFGVGEIKVGRRGGGDG